MSKKKTAINPKRAERLKTLIREQGMKQTEFAEKVHFSQQLISQIINQKTALTEETAAIIASAFPEYSASWLLGYSDDKNSYDAFMNSIQQMNEEGDLLNNAFTNLAALNGYKVNRLGYQGDSIEKVISSLYEYVEIEKNGEVKTLTIEQLNQLENIICEHAEIAIRQYLKGVEINGKYSGKKK